MSSIRVSEKHGVNPSLSVCFYCGKDKNDIILAGRLPGDAEAPHRAVWSKEPCDGCKGYMAQGVMFISVRDGEEGDNPYRTGNMAVVTDEGVKRIGIKPKELEESILKSRVAFIPDAAWDLLGLPK